MKNLLATLSLATLLAVILHRERYAATGLEGISGLLHEERFPNTPFEDFVNGVYSIDPASRANNGKTSKNSLPMSSTSALVKRCSTLPSRMAKPTPAVSKTGGSAIRQNYPYFDTDRGEVITLELAINECRQANGEKPLKWKKGPILRIYRLTWLPLRTGKVFDIKIPG